MLKFLITILTSYNEDILFQTFNSILGKNAINYSYTIVIIVNSKKYKLKLLSDFISVSPELDKLLVTLIIMSKPS